MDKNGNKTELKLTVIIVTYNSENYIQQCLSFTTENKNAIEYEIIVVDNNSDDSTVSILKIEFPEVTIIENNQNVGFAKANNQAIKVAKGNYLLLLNPDTEIKSETIEKFYTFMENDKNKNIWCVGGILFDENNKPMFSFGRFPRLYDVFFEQLGFHIIFKSYYFKNILQLNQNIPTNNFKVDFISGACQFLNLKIIKELGCFDEDFFLNYEEVDLAYRSKIRNLYCYILPSLKILHYGQKSYATNKDFIKNLKISQLIFFKKRSISKYLIAKYLLIFGTVIRIVINNDSEKKYLLKELFLI